METTQLSEAFEDKNSDDDIKISEDIVEVPAIENNNDDIELNHNDVDYLSETAVVFKTDNHLPITENQSPHGKCWDDRQTMFATEQGHIMSTSV